MNDSACVFSNTAEVTKRKASQRACVLCVGNAMAERKSSWAMTEVAMSWRVSPCFCCPT